VEDRSTPNRAANREKAEGERPGTEQSHRDEATGGITNRPLDEEIASQEALPERGETDKKDGTR